MCRMQRHPILRIFMDTHRPVHPRLRWGYQNGLGGYLAEAGPIPWPKAWMESIGLRFRRRPFRCRVREWFGMELFGSRWAKAPPIPSRIVTTEFNGRAWEIVSFRPRAPGLSGTEVYLWPREWARIHWRIVTTDIIGLEYPLLCLMAEMRCVCIGMAGNGWREEMARRMCWRPVWMESRGPAWMARRRLMPCGRWYGRGPYGWPVAIKPMREYWRIVQTKACHGPRLFVLSPNP